LLSHDLTIGVFSGYDLEMTARKIVVKIILWLILLILVGAIAYGAFLLYSINSLSNRVSDSKSVGIFSTISSLVKSVESKEINLKKSADGRINVLLLGVAGKGKPGQNLTDTIILLSINLKTNQVALLSLPRDFYVLDMNMKINAIYQAGLNNAKNDSEAIAPLLTSVKEITSQEVNYYAVLNFDGFKKIVDAIGGVNITNERDIYDPRYPGANYSYETFELKKGLQHLNGDMALKYARERHDDPDGDFGRSRRQQQIIQAVKNKVFSTSTLFNITTLNNLFNTLGDNIKANLSQEELSDFFELTKKLDTVNISNAAVDAWNPDSLLRVSHILYGDVLAFVLIPRVGNYSEIEDLAQNIFDLNVIKRRRAEIAKENASIILINKSGDNTITPKIKKMLGENLTYQKVSVMDDANTDSESTTFVYDLTDGIKPFTLDELALKLPASVSYSLPERYRQLGEKNQAEIVLVIGKDLISRYNMAEDSIEDFKKAQETEDYLINPTN